MRKISKLFIGLAIVLFGALGSSLFASSEIDKLEDSASVVKVGYQYTNDNAERTDKYSGFVRYKKDVEFNSNIYTLTPVGSIKYSKTDDEEVNNKYLASLLIEHLFYKDTIGTYGKISTDKDESNLIDNRMKYGIGLYQYAIKTNTFVVKIREGLQYVSTNYTEEVDLSNDITYFKIGGLVGYKLNDNLFLKIITDYDIAFNDNNILDVSIGMDIKMSDKISLETLFTYTDNGNDIDNLNNVEKEVTTSLVYNF